MNIKKILKGMPKYQVKNDHGKLTHPETDGLISITATKTDRPQPRVGYPNLWAAPGYGFDEEMYKNVCLWYDHTLKAMKGHDVRNCKWKFDGQIWRHL